MLGPLEHGLEGRAVAQAPARPKFLIPTPSVVMPIHPSFGRIQSGFHGYCMDRAKYLIHWHMNSPRYVRVRQESPRPAPEKAISQSPVGAALGMNAAQYVVLSTLSQKGH